MTVVMLATIAMGMIGAGAATWTWWQLPRHRRVQPVVLDTSLQRLARVTRQTA